MLSLAPSKRPKGLTCGLRYLFSSGGGGGSVDWTSAQGKGMDPMENKNGPLNPKLTKYGPLSPLRDGTILFTVRVLMIRRILTFGDL